MFNFKLWLEQNKTYKYAVVLLKIPNDISKKIQSFSTSYIPNKNIYEPEGRELKSHITVLYGFSDKDLKNVQETLKNQKPFMVNFSQISRFENKKEYDVIKIDAEGNELFKLNKKLKTIPHYSSYNTYKPHCTIAYVKKGLSKNINKDYFKSIKFKVDKLYFADTNKKEYVINLEY